MTDNPRIKLAHLPTPVEELPRLTKALGGPRILVKRDDLTGLAFGGNKARKLEFLVAEALAANADMLITAGALQSNHCRQTAAAAARAGMACQLVVFGDPPERPSGNLWLDQLLGAELIYASRDRRKEALSEAFDSARLAGRKPFLIPYGGSNSTGALGYAHALLEMVEQRITPDWIVFASSSGGTQAGLLAGAHHASFGGRVLGISVDEPRAELQRRVAALATETAARLGDEHSFREQDVLVSDEYCQAGYGVLTPAEREAIQLFARTEGLLVDPVYTGRAASGLIDLVRQGKFSNDDTLLFWHTGGTPALFVDHYASALL